MSKVTRNGKSVRPSWDYIDNNSSTSIEFSTLEMTESVRNVLEDIRRSQMLQCDVAHAIKDIAKTLKRIDRRLSKVPSLKL